MADKQPFDELRAKPWEQQEEESSKAFAAFSLYLQQPAATRSVDAAWRQASNRQERGNHAPGFWTARSVKYSWLARATAHDAYLAKIEQDERDAIWLERRRIARDRDYTQADALRHIFDEALPQAERFIRTQRTIVPARGDTPEREVITMSFDIVGLSKVLAEASKLQRLSNNESTENIELSGAALYAAIRRELGDVASSSATHLLSGATEEEPSG